MGAIINYTKFVDPIYIDTSDVHERDNVNNNYCPYVEKKMLKKLFGITLYTDFDANKTIAKYATLINGDTTAFTYNGYTKVFTGLKDMLAYFTYYFYIRKQNRFNTQMGQMQAKVQNAERISPAEDSMFAWNEGVKLYYETIDYINYKNDLVADTYANFLSEDLEEINSFGI